MKDKLVKFRKLPLSSMRTPDISITRVNDGKYHLFNEKKGYPIGTFSKESLIQRTGLTKSQLDRVKGTTNFIRVGVISNV